MADVLIVYGSTTGNTEMVAEQVMELLEGKDVTLKDVADVTPEELGEFEAVIMGSSTWDDGLLQADFRDFAEDLDVSLSGKKMAVFGLGDSSYPAFCEAAGLLEEVVAKLGGELIVESLKIDGFPDEEENEEKVKVWVGNLKKKL